MLCKRICGGTLVSEEASPIATTVSRYTIGLPKEDLELSITGGSRLMPQCDGPNRKDWQAVVPAEIWRCGVSMIPERWTQILYPVHIFTIFKGM